MRGNVVSVTVGKVQRMQVPPERRIDFKEPTWRSGIFKTPATGPVRVGPAGMAGDEQADLNFHGGSDNVVLAYAARHYPIWVKDLEMLSLPYGSFGENLTLDGDFADDAVCIGDTWRVGSEKDGVLLQVTQPRQPCYKLARRLERVHVVKMVKDRGWGGWYSRVLRAGDVQTGMEVVLVERLHPQWTCAAAAAAMYARNKDPGPADELSRLPELSARWKQELLE